MIFTFFENSLAKNKFKVLSSLVLNFENKLYVIFKFMYSLLSEKTCNFYIHTLIYDKINYFYRNKLFIILNR